ncbi:MAG: hypothetical protein ACLU38_16055 [Dysosmobacter sp.]
MTVTSCGLRLRGHRHTVILAVGGEGVAQQPEPSHCWWRKASLIAVDVARRSCRSRTMGCTS